MKRIKHEIEMANRAFSRQVVPGVFFKPLYDHERERWINRSTAAPSLLVKGRVVRGDGWKRILRTKSLWILQVVYEAIRLVFIWYLAKQRPEGGDCLGRETVALFVQIAIDVEVFIPHLRIDPGFQRKILSLVPEAQFLVVQNIADCRNVQCVDRLLSVEVDEVPRILPGRVIHPGSGERYDVEAGVVLEGLFEPGEVFLEVGYYISQPFFVADFVVQVELSP